MTRKAKRLTKYEIACAIERLPGNRPWGLYSQYTLVYDLKTRPQIVATYNRLIAERGLDLPFIS